MKRARWLGLMAGVAFVTACVTINVYFPEAQAEKAAEQFIDNVIGPDAAKPAPAPEAAPADTRKPPALSALFDVIPSAQAQADISIETPAIKAIQSRMAERFQSSLQAHFDSGALGLTRDGLIEVRDAAGVPLAARTAVKQAVADDNRDRAAVYREIAVANGHAEWEADIRNTFAKQWISSAHAGWYYQDESGAWKRK